MNCSLITLDYFFLPASKRIVNKLLFPKKFRNGPFEVEEVLKIYVQNSKFNWVINKINSDTDIVFCEGLNPLYLEKIVFLKRFIPFKLIVHHGFSSIDELKEKSLLNSFDLIITPSDWVRNLFVEQSFPINVSIKSLPIPISEILFSCVGENFKYVLLYNKSSGFSPSPDFSEMIDTVRNLCVQYGLSYKEISYGEYVNLEYYRLLSNAMFLVYLSKQETQGLALMRAWQMDVPTLIYDNGTASWNSISCIGSSAPYYHPAVGEKFTNKDELKLKFPFMINNKYTPRRYHLSNFTYEIIFNKIDCILEEI